MGERVFEGVQRTLAAMRRSFPVITSPTGGLASVVSGLIAGYLANLTGSGPALTGVAAAALWIVLVFLKKLSDIFDGEKRSAKLVDQRHLRSHHPGWELRVQNATFNVTLALAGPGEEERITPSICTVTDPLQHDYVKTFYVQGRVPGVITVGGPAALYPEGFSAPVVRGWHKVAWLRLPDRTLLASGWFRITKI